MKDLEKIKDILIDDFYNEEHEKIEDDIIKDNEFIEFNEKLNLLEEKLSLVENETYDFDIDTLDIIEKAESINEKRKIKKELILFSAVAAVVLFLYSAATLKLGIRFLAISQGIVVALIPWIVIPIAILNRKGSEI